MLRELHPGPKFGRDRALPRWIESESSILEIPCYGEDYDLFYMRIRLVSPIACIDQPLVAYRIHGSNLGGLTAENSGRGFGPIDKDAGQGVRGLGPMRQPT